LKNGKITVVGSINMDLVTSANRVPAIGETVLGETFHMIPGGKGANQAVAAARLGADTTLISCVGNDSFGLELLEHLKKQGVNTQFVETVKDLSTGIASITLANGDNQIIVVPGANFKVTPELVAKNEDVIASSDILLLQLEIPLPSVEKAVELANKHGVKVILNPAPFLPLSKELLQKIDVITLNASESELLFEVNWTAAERADILKKCIITKGSKGIVFFQGHETEISGFRVDVVDTTGAGDTFNGALAYSLSGGMAIDDACVFANAAAALSVTKLGAQGGMPAREAVLEFLKRRGISTK
jgi:ribokinase